MVLRDDVFKRAAACYPEVETESVLVDAVAAKFVLRPKSSPCTVPLPTSPGRAPERFGLPGEAARLHKAIEITTAAGVLTRDVAGTASAEDVTKALIDALGA